MTVDGTLCNARWCAMKWKTVSYVTEDGVYIYTSDTCVMVDGIYGGLDDHTM